MALLSPGIEFFESSVTPAAETVSYTNGVATLGFATRGPVNTLVRVESSSDFNYMFGDPVEGYPWSHILATNVLANDSVVYFMRLANESADRSRCAVANTEIEGAQVLVQSKYLKDGSTEAEPYTKTYFIGRYDSRHEFTKPVYLRIGFAGDYSATAPAREKKAVYAKMTKSASWDGMTKVFYVSMLDVLTAAKDKLGSSDLYNFTRVGSASLGYGILTSAIDEINEEFPAVVTATDTEGLSIKIGYYQDGIFEELESSRQETVDKYIVASGTFEEGTTYYKLNSTTGEYEVATDWTAGATIPANTYYTKGTETTSITPVTEYNTFVTTGTVLGKTLRLTSTIDSADITANYHFNIYAKYSGSGMDGVKVIKSSVVSSVGATTTWSINVLDTSGVTLESYKGLTGDNFISKINTLSSYIEIDDEVAGETVPTADWLDGTYVLGKGQLLSSGNYLCNDGDKGTEFLTASYLPVAGNDGLPLEPDGVTVDNSQVVDMYIAGLGDDAFLNCDENSFSILATPSCGELLVQNAAIEVCSNRGDSIYLVDTPYDYCVLGKDGITDILSWSNSNAGFQNSQAAIYYGWFSQTNPYDTTSNVECPASVYVAPKMIALDNTMGEFYAPAGVSTGSIVVSDYLYSPDSADRDKMVGNDNVVNPIIYSNTRGVMIFAQKTTDRTTSPLNRVGIRRMTNAIKRTLRSRLQELLFQPNNAASRTRARTIISNVFASLKSSGVISTYSIDVQSGTGAERNTLNIYLDFSPYGLIEKIYIYVNISDSDVTVTESTT